ncbi:H-2 class II histocompatibility antigen, A-U alpha chain-like isoform X1 [Sparus aurata]|uniref:H-2 class II histocompatibility antigen, A-U alpha chain-like isoform X1 n=1 Tax=Sparus aurata TaxID=8175 RepID=UPI0011C12498|nr:H-2 class II histocompatibility antigen, A-U alpha chain-like isoform X1 [Sparus aurata]
MMIRRDMKRSLLIILILNACCVFSQSKTAHDALYLVGCFENGTTEVQFELDSEEVFYVNFKREEVVYTMPKFVVEDPTQILEIHHLYRNAARAKSLCPVAATFIKAEEKNPPEERDPPESILYPAVGLQLGDENTLICFVNHFYPPDIRVSWTKNGDPVSEGVSLSRYFLNKDQTFHQFSTLTFTPSEGDVYSCTVEHLALARPLTRIWEPEFTHPSHVPEIFCGVGLTLGLLGVAAGTVLLVKGHHGQ